MGKYTNDIKSLSNELSRQELLDVCEKWIEVQERWDNTQPGGYYMEWGWDNELFCHQILDINPFQRICSVMDYSVKSHPIKTIDYLPESFPTEQEAVAHYSKKYM